MFPRKEQVRRLIDRVAKVTAIVAEHHGDRERLLWFLHHAPRLEKFRDRHRGEDCFIIGNGPSLRTMDLTPLRQHHTFGLNKIHLLLDKTPLDLSYHVAVNPLVIEQSLARFQSLTCPSFLSFYGTAHHDLLPGHIHYVMTSAPWSFQADITRPMYEGYTVTYVALQIAFFMGFSRVFLIGVDHNFTCQGNPNERQLLQGEDPNHFDPSYFANQAWHLPDLEGSELSYQLARFAFTRNGRRIVDATVGGKLLVFPKMSYSEALATCSRKR